MADPLVVADILAANGHPNDRSLGVLVAFALDNTELTEAEIGAVLAGATSERAARDLTAAIADPETAPIPRIGPLEEGQVVTPASESDAERAGRHGRLADLGTGQFIAGAGADPGFNFPESGVTEGEVSGNLLDNLIAQLGLTDDQVIELGVAGILDLADAFGLLPDSGGGGGGGGLDPRLAALYGAQTEGQRLSNERLAAQLAGDLNFIEVRPGIYYDPISGQLVDEASLAENARQFDEDLRFRREQEEGAESRFQAGLAEQRASRLQQGELTRRGLALEGEQAALQAQQDFDEFRAEVLRNPADFLARAFALRGEQSPNAEVTQADLINTAQSALQQFRSRLDQFSAPLPEFGGQAGFSPEATAAILANPQTAAGPPRLTSLDDFLAANPQIGIQPREDGGEADGRLILVGEDGPELIENPSNARLNVIPVGDGEEIKSAQTGGAFGGFSQEAYEALQGRRLNPTLPGTIEGSNRARAAYLTSQTPTEANLQSVRGLEGFDEFGRVVAPDSGGLTQGQILAEAIANQPPGVRDVLAGRLPSPAQFDIQLPTPRLLQSLTPDELEALRTRLAAQNISLDDLLFSVGRRFGRTGQRMGRLVV